MLHSAWIRRIGLVAMIGGASWIGFLLWGVVSIVFGQYAGSQAVDDWPFPFIIFPATWVIFIVSLAGLQLHSEPQRSWLNWVGFILAIVGMGIEFIGLGGLAWGRIFGIWSATDCSQDPWRCTALAFLQPLYMRGFVVLGVGMALYGTASLRTRPTSRRNIWLIGMGVIALACYFFTAEGAPEAIATSAGGLLATGLVFAAFFLTWGVGWCILGRDLLAEPMAPLAVSAMPLTSE